MNKEGRRNTENEIVRNKAAGVIELNDDALSSVTGGVSGTLTDNGFYAVEVGTATYFFFREDNVYEPLETALSNFTGDTVEELISCVSPLGYSQRGHNGEFIFAEG